MADQKTQPWSRPVVVADVPDRGEHIEITADEETRTGIAKVANLRSLPRLSASFDVMRSGAEGLRVTGKISATVGQNCVVTLEPIENEVEESFEVTFAPAQDIVAVDEEDKDAPASAAMSDQAPEPITGGAIDLGALATEHLLLGIDPYPRKPGVVFEPPAVEEDPATHPFAALAALKKSSQTDEK
jgi:uncharacterized metal-binding protein YceD (DUF177 family)